MSDFRSQVERAMVDWWTQNGVRSDLEFRFPRAMEQRVFDSVPSSFQSLKGSARITQFMGMPVFVDDAVPDGELHVYDREKKLLHKITGLTP